MTTSSTRDVAIALVEAYGRAMRDGDMAAIAPLLADDVVFHVAYPFERFKNDLRGRSTVLDTLAFGRGELDDRITFQTTGVLIDGDRATIQVAERGTTGGVEYESSLAFVLAVERGLVTELRIYLGWIDPSAVLRAILPPADHLPSVVLGAEDKLAAAILSRDRDAAAAMIADDFVATGHAGNLVDKGAYLDVHFSPKRRFMRFDREERQVSAVAGAALVVGQVTMLNALAASNPPPARYTAIWEPTGDSWRLRAWQETPVDAAAQF